MFQSGSSQPGGMPAQPQITQMTGMGQPGQQPMGQPQFQVIQQPPFAPGGQYATFPQIATFNQQGQLVLQPPQFMQPGQPGQPGQYIISGVPQPQPGKPNMMGSQPSTPGKPIAGQPQYTITSTGQLQMQPNQPGQQQTFIMPPQMMQGAMPGQVSMPGPGQQPQVSMAQMKGTDGKPVMSGPPQTMPPQQSPQQLVQLPNGQMAYVQTGPGPQPMQMFIRSPAPDGQQVMFSPGPPTAPPQNQAPPNMPNVTAPMPSPMAMPPARPTGPPGPPPGKTAISRSIAPLLPAVTQSAPRMGFNTPGGNLPTQPSPKSKQKMSPRGGNIGPGRPPGPKSLATPKMVPKLPPGSPLAQANDLLNNASPKPPTLQTEVVTSIAGPPTLTPMLVPAPPPPVSLATTPAPPQSMMVSMPSIPVKPLYQMATSLPTSTVAPLPPHTSVADAGPPMLTKEVNPPMPNLGPPNISGPPQPGQVMPPLSQPHPALAPKQMIMTKPPTSTPDMTTDTTPKAVVKPQVFTHVIDGHIIKESSAPFPVSPSKSKYFSPSQFFALLEFLPAI